MVNECVSDLMLSFTAGEDGLGGSSGDVLTASLVERDEGNSVSVVSSHSNTGAASDAAAAAANSTTTLLDSNFDHQSFSDGFTFHVTVRIISYWIKLIMG